MNKEAKKEKRKEIQKEKKEVMQFESSKLANCFPNAALL